MNDSFRAPIIVRIVLLALLMPAGTSSYASTADDYGSADRAVVIAKQARAKVEQSGKLLQSTSKEMFTEFARATGELQKLIDTRNQLEQAGLLSKDDPDGLARRANLNARILLEVGTLKKVCDKNIDNLLLSLDSFDRSVADSLVDTQATRSLNSNYELALNRYITQEKKAFVIAAASAQKALESYRSAADPMEKNRLKKKYMRLKKRLQLTEQRRRIYESRIKVAEMNQKMTGVIRDKIRRDGGDVPERFRKVMTELYTLFSKIVPVAEAGVTGMPDAMADMGFDNMTKLNETLEIVEDSTAKLNSVLDDMVGDVLAGLGDIQVVDDGSLTGKALSVEDEMEYLNRQRMSWNRE
ncbi:MAG: hypothetical protein GXP53_06645 [Deltaproteobacteria bacterium]|nr:hypothetical protein [Deltaproteobacteria bacterium]